MRHTVAQVEHNKNVNLWQGSFNVQNTNNKSPDYLNQGNHQEQQV